MTLTDVTERRIAVLEAFTVRKTSPIAGRPYQWVSARAQYAVDPDDPGTAQIADLGLVPRDADGKVRFAGDVVLLRPVGGGNGRALLVVPNRGLANVPFSGIPMQFAGTGDYSIEAEGVRSLGRFSEHVGATAGE